MRKDVSIENWLVRGTVFILIFTIGCFVWFEYQMSTVERNDSDYRVETQHIDESSQTGQNEIIHREIDDAVEQDTSGNNSSDPEETDDKESEERLDKFQSRKS